MRVEIVDILEGVNERAGPLLSRCQALERLEHPSPAEKGELAMNRWALSELYREGHHAALSAASGEIEDLAAFQDGMSEDLAALEERTSAAAALARCAGASIEGMAARLRELEEKIARIEAGDYSAIVGGTA
jgi:DNA repair ATPase RecN